MENEKISFFSKEYKFFNAGDEIKVLYKNIGEFYIPSSYKGLNIEIKDAHTLLYPEEITNNFEFVLNGAKENMKNVLTKNELVYIDKNSGYTLFGLPFIGIVDRDTNVIEIKLITGCNLNCIFCSVAEGNRTNFIDFKANKKKFKELGFKAPKNYRKTKDYYVDPDYVIEQLRKLLKRKEELNENPKFDQYEIHFSTHGEPLLYYDLEYLVSKLNKIEKISRISMDTNLVPKSLEELKNLMSLGLNQINVSIESLDEKRAEFLSGTNRYKVKSVVEKTKALLKFISEENKKEKYQTNPLRIFISPMFIKGFEKDLKDLLIEFKNFIVEEKIELKQNKLFGIQNYLNYKSGRTIYRNIDFDSFFETLKKYESELDLDLILSKEDFNIIELKGFLRERNNSVLDAKIIDKSEKGYIVLFEGKDHYSNGILYENKPIQLNSKKKVKIIKNKDNIYSLKLYR